MTERQQDHLEQYNHDIEAARKKFIPALLVSLGVVLVICICYVLETQRRARIRQEWFEQMNGFANRVMPDYFIPVLDPNSVYTVVGFIVAIFGFGVLFVAIPYGWSLFTMIRFRNVARKYSPIVHGRVVFAYNNVKEFLASPLEQAWRPSLLERLCQRYTSLDRVETSELKQKLERAGVWNTGVKWYDKGKTLDEALMLVIYTARQAKESVTREATEKSLAFIEGQNIAAANLQSRKILEQQKEAAVIELDHYTKAAATTTREPLPLSTFSGEYTITHTEQKAVAVTLRLDEQGEFEIYRREGKSRSHLKRVVGGQQISIELSPPAESGRLEVVRAGDGEFDTISLP